MCYNASLDLIAEMCGIAYTTAFEWRHRVFATIDGYQDRLKLRGCVWIDELYPPTPTSCIASGSVIVHDMERHTLRL